MLVVAGCSLSPPPRDGLQDGRHIKPARIVSLDFCADQFVLKLADRTHIAAVSPDADASFSYMRVAAKGLPQVRPDAEAIIALAPDLVVRTYGGGPQLAAQLEQAGIKVHQIGWGEGFDAVRTHALETAKALGEEARGADMVAEFDRRLAAIKPAQGLTALYVTPGGVTTGPGSMVDAMMARAGLTNFQATPGWSSLPLERLTEARPDILVTAFFTDQSSQQDYWSAARNPMIGDLTRSIPVVRLEGATTACGGWFMMDAMEAMAKTGREAHGQSKRLNGSMP